MRNFILKTKIGIIAAFFIVHGALASQTNPEVATAKYFETIKDNPQQLLIFLQNMPKGGDLHNHTGGSSMAENMIRYGMQDNLCVNRKDNSLSVNPSCATTDLLQHVVEDPTLYNTLIDAWSMRNFYPGKESGHDHFFASFMKYSPISSAHSAEILAEITDRAGNQNELYLELMVTPELASSLGDKVGWDADLAKLREKLLANGMNELVSKVSQDLDNDEKTQRKILHCDTKQPAAGCDVKVRYLFQILREQQPVEVYAQLLAGFEAASKDKRIVGINMVQPEDGYLAMRDYELHMQMVGFLHELYPHVHISLHAGELNSSLVPPEGLRFHIHDAISVAKAERIGHGVDVVYENNPDQLLKEMALKHIMVEINLTSNAAILGIEGKNHPLPQYMYYHVPVALSTDDEGVLRTYLTLQYQKAILTYHFSYPIIKNLARNSISYSFLPGKTLWQDYNYQVIASACAKDNIGSKIISPACQTFLHENEKASLQWELEKRFKKFESQYV